MAETKTYGLLQVLAGTVLASGDFPDAGDMTELCKTYKNSCEFTEADPTITDEFSDQQDDPIHTFIEKGSKEIKFSTFDYTPATLVKLKGGTSLNDVWSEPATIPEIFQAIELKLASGNSFKFPKCRIFAKFNAKLVKNGLSLLEVTIKPVLPADGKPVVMFG